MSLIRFTKGAGAQCCSTFYATISIREAESFNQLIMDVRGACSDRTMRPHTAITQTCLIIHTKRKAKNVPKLQQQPDNQLKPQSLILHFSTLFLSL